VMVILTLLKIFGESFIIKVLMRNLTKGYEQRTNKTRS
jgi:hypothetical protein